MRDTAVLKTNGAMTDGVDGRGLSTNQSGAAENPSWDYARLRTVSDINYGFTERASSEPVGPRFLRITDIQDSVPFCKIELAELHKYQLQSGDIVFARTGATTGKSFLVYDPPTAVFASYLIRFRLLGHRLLPEFVSLFFQTSRYWKSIKDGSSGSAQGGFNATKLGALSIPIPPLSEQRRIVGILDEAFEGIATAKANAEKNLQNARALFESHPQAVFTQRGDGWDRAVPLMSVLAVQPRNGWSPPIEYQTGAGIPVLTLSSVTGFEYDGTRVKMSSAPTRDDAHYWLQHGELLVTRSNTQQLVGHVAMYDGTPQKAICCDLIMKMQVDGKKAHTRFIYFYLRSPEARSYLTSRAQGASSTMKKIGKQVVQNIPIPLPSLTQQKAATEKLDAIREETQRLESLCRRKLAALDELKKSLLHRAFSGTL
ncbi:MAG: hypothetical protein EXS09_22205 [Gemmataceae bacterium]|nr:hypothetical protein [Gemmataceae bacterium]